MNNEELGALWSKKTKEGDDYFSGLIKLNEKALEIVVFKNKYKTADKHPDYRILRLLRSKPREEEVPTVEPHPGDSIPF